MHIISSYLHGITDYALGLVLLLAPEIFGFDELSGAFAMIPRWCGCAIIAQALCTNYELGLIRNVSFAMHRFNDSVCGLALVISAWSLGSYTTQARAVALATGSELDLSFAGALQSEVSALMGLGIVILIVSLCSSASPCEQNIRYIRRYESKNRNIRYRIAG